MRKYLVILLVTLPLLAACDNHKGEHCVHSTTMIIPINVGKGQFIYVPETDCDTWEKNNVG